MKIEYRGGIGASIPSAKAAILTCFLLFATAAQSASLRLDEQLLRFANDIKEQLRGKGVEKLAVVDFEFIDGRKSSETKYITEQFTMYLARQVGGEFRLIERGDLSAIRNQTAEQIRLLGDALLDRAKMTSRNVVGVDSIVRGTVAPLPSGTELTVKVLDVRTANLHTSHVRVIDIPRFSIPGLNTIKETATDRKLREAAEKQRKVERAAEQRQGTRSDPVFALAGRLVAKLHSSKVSKLAITELVLDGQRGVETKYITDQLTTWIFSHKPSFKIVGRGDIEAILAAYTLEEGIAKEIKTDIAKESSDDIERLAAERLRLDPSTMTRLGIQGVDAILVGTITRLSPGPELSIKALEIKTAAIHVVDKCWIDVPQLTPKATSTREAERERQLRAAAERADKEEKRTREQRANAERRAAQVLADAAISGCTGVQVHPRAVRRPPYLLQTGSVTMRVLNTHSGPVNISDENGEIVSNLCSGGGITLIRYLPPLASRNESLQYTATGRLKDGRVGIDRHHFTMIQAERRQDTWEIRLSSY